MTSVIPFYALLAEFIRISVIPAAMQ